MPAHVEIPRAIVEILWANRVIRLCSLEHVHGRHAQRSPLDVFYVFFRHPVKSGDHMQDRVQASMEHAECSCRGYPLVHGTLAVEEDDAGTQTLPCQQRFYQGENLCLMVRFR